MSDDLEWSLKLEICRLELAKERMHAAESALATEELRRFLAEAQAEVALRNGECEAKSRIISDLENENSKLRNRIGVLQASPPACEGERVDVEVLVSELSHEVLYAVNHDRSADMLARISIAIRSRLRRHFPPAAAKPAVQDEQLTPANEKFLDEMLASKPAAGGEKPAQALPADDGERVREIPKCDFCGQPTMHAGNTCFTCTKNESNRNRRLELEKQLAAQSAELDALRSKIKELGQGFEEIRDCEKNECDGCQYIATTYAAIAAKEDKPNA